LAQVIGNMIAFLFLISQSSLVSGGFSSLPLTSLENLTPTGIGSVEEEPAASMDLTRLSSLRGGSSDSVSEEELRPSVFLATFGSIEEEHGLGTEVSGLLEDARNAAFELIEAFFPGLSTAVSSGNPIKNQFQCVHRLIASFPRFSSSERVDDDLQAALGFASFGASFCDVDAQAIRVNLRKKEDCLAVARMIFRLLKRQVKPDVDLLKHFVGSPSSASEYAVTALDHLASLSRLHFKIMSHEDLRAGLDELKALCADLDATEDGAPSKMKELSSFAEQLSQEEMPQGLTVRLNRKMIDARTEAVYQFNLRGVVPPFSSPDDPSSKSRFFADFSQFTLTLAGDLTQESLLGYLALHYDDPTFGRSDQIKLGIMLGDLVSQGEATIPE